MAADISLQVLTSAIKDGRLVLSIPLRMEPLTRSRGTAKAGEAPNGPNYVLCSTGGFLTLPVSYDGKPVRLNLNAMVQAS